MCVCVCGVCGVVCVCGVWMEVMMCEVHCAGEESVGMMGVEQHMARSGSGVSEECV
jgi:hypothetical protein